MSKSVGPGRIGSSRRFIKILTELVDFLPTIEEKKIMQASLKALSNYLQDAERDLAQIPTKEDMGQLSMALKRVEMLLIRAEENPFVSRAFGIEHKRSQKKIPVSPQPPERIKRIREELDQLTIDQLRDTLSSSAKYTSDDLRGLAIMLGIRSNPRLSRDTLANQITIKITNDRGYKRLGELPNESNTATSDVEEKNQR